MAVRARSRLRGRGAVLLAGVLALAGATPLIAPASARAASYEVSACGDSPDERTNNAWDLVNNRTSHLDSDEECPASDKRPPNYPNVSDLDGLWIGDYLANEPGGPSSDVPASSEALWRFDAPDGTEVTRLRYNRYLGKQDDDNWRPFLRDASGSTIETCSIPQGDSRCRVGDAGWYPNSFRDIGGLSTDRLEVGLRCTAQNVCLNGGRLHLAWATIYAARVTIEDDRNPTITNVRGPLVDDGRARGTEEVSFDAKDNAGVKEVALRVDGNDAGKADLPCDYTYARPCDDFNGPLSLDTTRHSNGAHTLEIRTTDAAGNEASETRAVLFDNPSSGGSNDDDRGSGRGGRGGSDGGSSGGGSGGAAPRAKAPRRARRHWRRPPSPSPRRASPGDACSSPAGRPARCASRSTTVTAVACGVWCVLSTRWRAASARRSACRPRSAAPGAYRCS